MTSIKIIQPTACLRCAVLSLLIVAKMAVRIRMGVERNWKWDNNRRMELRMERKISSGKICESGNLNKNRNGNESGIRTSLQSLFHRFSL